MSDIIIERQDASTICIYTEDAGIVQELYERYRYSEPTFTKNKWSKWDGTVRMFNRKTGAMPYGCLQSVLALAKTRQWSVELDPRFKNDITNIDGEQIESWVDSLNLHSGGVKIEPYDYQMQGLHLAIKYGRMTLLAATSAGKSLLIYMLTRFYLETMNPGDKFLIIVPSTNLVSQLVNDFKDYSSANGWDTDQHVHFIMEGRPKFSNKPVYISTWQSIFEQPKDYFHQFTHIIEDEVHGASGKSISNILNSSIYAYKRIGLTGTLKNEKIHSAQIESMFGPIKRIVSTKELIDAGRATPTNITLMQLDYSDYERNAVSTMSYQQEIEFIVGHAYRNKIIENLSIGLKGNTLILFDRKDSHLMKVYESLKTSGKNVFVINGDVKVEERNLIKALVEKGDDITILATSLTMSTGVSIKKLHNLVFAHPSKSIIKVLQSIGRLLRLHGTKEVANIYDIADNLKSGDRVNFSLRHAFIRLGYYKDESHPVKIKRIQMKNHEDMINANTVF